MAQLESLMQEHFVDIGRRVGREPGEVLHLCSEEVGDEGVDELPTGRVVLIDEGPELLVQ